LKAFGIPGTLPAHRPPSQLPTGKYMRSLPRNMQPFICPFAPPAKDEDRFESADQLIGFF